MKAKENDKDKVKWESIEILESIANQCIYKGKEVARARALLKQLYQKDISYDDDANCSNEPSEDKE